MTTLRDDADTMLVLPPDVRSVRRAREAVRSALAGAGPTDLLDDAVLVVSELATNAVLHAGTEVTLRVWATSTAIRVELDDGSSHDPVQRPRPSLGWTGRGLQIVEDCVDRWGVTPTSSGKRVWFEIGDPGHRRAETPHEDPAAEAALLVHVSLRQVPLLLHWAWQEHAASLLREYLLYSLDQDPSALERHARASEALGALADQLPRPALPADADELMVGLVEPTVTSDEVVLSVPRAALPAFDTLDRLLTEAVAAATAGSLLGWPTQPEIMEMRRWLCGEIAAQAAGAPTPTSWRAFSGIAAMRVDGDLDDYRKLAADDDAVIVANENGVIVAATWPTLSFLGCRAEGELVAARILQVIPERFHQAHIAGLTLHATAGRDAIFGQWVTAPVRRADGGEATVEFRIEQHRTADDRPAFVATFRLP